ncbi:MAG: DUF3368 domain-containing protein [Candidatus Thermoplasmatota archaeon]|nr:DUF3368 domain-containing protein [Candidatus Thermoplasmatota archaeon]
MPDLVFDATTLIHIGRAGLLDNLKDLDDDLLIPYSIYEEVVLLGKQKGRLDALRTQELVRIGIMKVVEVERGEMHSILSENRSLSNGDIDVIELAHLRKGIAIMDESYGQAVCDIEKVQHRGTIWILRQMVMSGSISRQEAKEYLDRLIEEGWYCSTTLYSKALRIFQGHTRSRS